jgi:beta-mannosidase
LNIFSNNSREGGIAQNPGDPKFGDVHFYAETANLWNDTTFPIPRCSSEFGVQSMPFRGTMLRWIPPEDWHYMSETLVRRQHHPGGILSLPALIFQHFPVLTKGINPI